MAVVYCDEAELPAIYPASHIGRIKCRLDSTLQILDELLGGASEWRGNAKANFTLSYPADGRRRLASSANSRNAGRRPIGGLLTRGRGHKTSGRRTRLLWVF